MKQRGRPTLETINLTKSIKTVDELQKFFDKRNEDPNGYVIRGFNLISYAMVYSHTADHLVPLLIKYGVDLEKRSDADGMTSIQIAVYFARTHIVRMHIDYGADVFATSHADKNVMDYSLTSHDDELFKILLDAGAPLPKKPQITADEFVKRNYDYVMQYHSTVQRRISSCRNSLLALLRLCNVSSFRALREMILQITFQVWAMRGGEGCGARGHGWAEEN